MKNENQIRYVGALTLKIAGPVTWTHDGEWLIVRCGEFRLSRRIAEFALMADPIGCAEDDAKRASHPFEVP